MKKRYFNSCYIEDFYKKWYDKIPANLQEEFQEDLYRADEDIYDYMGDCLWEQRAGEDV